MFVRTKDGKMRDWDKLTLDRLLSAYNERVRQTSMSASEQAAALADAQLLVDGLKAEVVKPAKAKPGGKADVPYHREDVKPG